MITDRRSSQLPDVRLPSAKEPDERLTSEEAAALGAWARAIVSGDWRKEQGASGPTTSAFGQRGAWVFSARVVSPYGSREAPLIGRSTVSFMCQPTKAHWSFEHRGLHPMNVAQAVSLGIEACEEIMVTHRSDAAEAKEQIG